MTRAILTHGIAEAQIWTPKLLPDLKLWLDAKDSASVTLVSGKVSQWDDKSGNNNHATQTTALNRPGYTTGEYVSFVQGSEQFLSVTGLSASTKDETAIVVGYFDNSNSMPAKRSTFFCSNSGGDGRQFRLDSNSLYVVKQGVVNLANVTRTWSANTTTIWGWTTIGGSNSFIGSVNGSEASATLSSTALGTGRTTQIGGITNSKDQDLNGRLSEAVVCQPSLSLADRQKLEGYLAWRWGLQGNLPSGHPYKNYRP